MIASSDMTELERVHKGKKIVLIGLGGQIACIGYFCFVAVRGGFKLRKHAKLIEQTPKVRSNGKNFQIIGKTPQ